jgi:glucokinase
MILAADIGGTNARLALFDPRDRPLQPRHELRLAVADFADPAAALARFTADVAAAGDGDALRVDAACLAIAGPVVGTRVALTNSPWVIDAEQTARALGGCPVRLVNDFAAAARGTTVLAADDLFTLQPGDAAPGANRVIIGAGTGLGVAYAIPDGDDWRIVSGEGGHAGFAPRDEAQAELWGYLQRRFGRVEAEHVVSGAGLVRIHDHLAGQRGAVPLGEAAETAEGPAEVTDRAARGDPVAKAALDMFASCYGAIAGDHALAVLAHGGVFVAGGIAPKLTELLAGGDFVAAFAEKAAFRPLMQRMPVHVVTFTDVGLLGAALIALDAFRRDGPRAGGESAGSDAGSAAPSRARQEPPAAKGHEP